MYTKLASQIINDVYSGLQGLHHNLSLSVEQLEDEIVQMRLSVIKEYQLKGILPIQDLAYSINCLEVDCKDLERCPYCRSDAAGTLTAHFEIPQLIFDFGESAILYIGSADRQNGFPVYISSNLTNQYQKYRRRGHNKPFVYIDPTPNENNLLDGFVFNAPFLKSISVVGIFKDMRQLEQLGCCEETELDNMNFIDAEVKERLTKAKIYYYRQLAAQNTPNDQTYK